VKNKYRIVEGEDYISGKYFFVQIKRWWFPVWLKISYPNRGYNSFRSHPDAEELARKYAKGFVVQTVEV